VAFGTRLTRCRHTIVMALIATTQQPLACKILQRTAHGRVQRERWVCCTSQDYVTKLLSEQHQQYAENITAEAAKRRALMQYVQNLEVRTSLSVQVAGLFMQTPRGAPGFCRPTDRLQDDTSDAQPCI